MPHSQIIKPFFDYVKSVQKLDISVAAADANTDKTITAVDVNKSIVIMHGCIAESAGTISDYALSADLTSSTNLRLARVDDGVIASADYKCAVSATVIEFNDIKSIQEIVLANSVTAGPASHAGLTLYYNIQSLAATVNVNKSFLVHAGFNAANGFSNTDYRKKDESGLVRILSDGSGIQNYAWASGNTGIQHKYYLVEFF